MTAEVSATGPRRTFPQVQRHAVRGPPPLRGKRKALIRRQVTDRGTRQNREPNSLLPCAELAERPHAATLAGTGSGLPSSSASAVHFFAGCPHVRRATCNVQRVTCNV